MERLFFSKNNYNNIYNIIGTKLFDKIKLDISSNKYYDDEIKNIMKSIFSQKNILKIDFDSLEDKEISNELSKKVINVAINYFIRTTNNIEDNKKSKQMNSFERDIKTINQNKNNKIDNRPIPSFVIEENDVNKKYEELQNERSTLINNKSRNTPIFKDKIDEPSINVDKKFEELSKIRDYESNDQNINKISSKDLLPDNNNIFNKDLVSQHTNNNIDNNFMTNLNEIDNNNSDLDSQFKMIIQSNISEIKNKFENTSVKDRYNEYQKELEKDKITNHVGELRNNTEKFNNVGNINDIDNIKNIDYDNNNQNNKDNMSTPISQLIGKSNISNFFPLINNDSNTIKKKKIKKNLIINSANRQWYGEILENNGVYTYFSSPYTSRYRYVVKFGPSSDSTIKQPIYENNKFKPLNINNEDDRIKMLSGITVQNNDNNGFTWNGIHYPKYNPSKDKGKIKDTYLSIIKGDNKSININSTFKNITKVSLKRLILPNNDNVESICIVKNKNNSVSSYNENLINNNQNEITPYNITNPTYVDLHMGNKNIPFILINIDELNSNIEYTNNFNKSLFAKPFYDKEYKNNNDRGWSYYKNDDGDHSIFSPTPLSELNKLTIEILKPDGTLLSDINDDILVNKIGWNSSGYNCQSLINTNNKMLFSEYEFIIIELNKYVHESNFKNGDKIIIKNLKFDNTNMLNSSQKSEIKEFLENDAYVVRWDNDTYWHNLHDTGLNKTNLKEIDYNGNKIMAHDDNNYRMINRIFIKNKRIFNSENGSYKLFGSDIDALKPTNGFDYITGKSIEDPINMINIYGFLLNLNVQHSMILEIEQEETQRVFDSNLI